MLKILKGAKGQSDKCQLYQEAVTMVMTRGRLETHILERVVGAEF